MVNSKYLLQVHTQYPICIICQINTPNIHYNYTGHRISGSALYKSIGHYPTGIEYLSIMIGLAAHTRSYESQVFITIILISFKIFSYNKHLRLIGLIYTHSEYRISSYTQSPRVRSCAGYPISSDIQSIPDT